MPDFHRRTHLPFPSPAVFGWHERPGAFTRLIPPWLRIGLVQEAASLGEGERSHFQLHLGPLHLDWVAEHLDRREGRSFTDRQVRGPFAAWTHVHEVEPADGGTSVLDEHITWRLPGGTLGAVLGGPAVRRALDRQFAWRHRLLAQDLARHRPYEGRERMHVAITGASGLVGSALGAFLTTGGHRVSRLVRREAGPGEIHWDPAAGVLDPSDLEGVDAVVHLAGEPISARWSADRKERVRRSRVEGTGLLARTLAALDRRPRVLVSASAIGYYGTSSSDEVLDESSPRGHGFLAEVCEAWEGAAEPARLAGIRVVHPRIGLVLTGAGGVLGRLLPPFLLGAGGPVGSGRQWMSWIQRDDLVYAIHEALWDPRWDGPFNAVTASPMRNVELGRTLGRVLRRPAVVPLPSLAVRLAFGEMGQALLLEGARVSPGRLADWGFACSQPELEGALRVELGRPERG